MDAEPKPQPALSRRAAALIALLVLTTFVAGALTFGVGPRQTPEPPRTPAPAAGCTKQKLRFVVTDDQQLGRRLAAYERTPASSELPEPGLYWEGVERLSFLHAGHHGFALLSLPEDTGPQRRRAVAALVERYVSADLPLLAAGEKRRGLVLVVGGAQFSCPTTSDRHLGEVRRYLDALRPPG